MQIRHLPPHPGIGWISKLLCKPAHCSKTLAAEPESNPAPERRENCHELKASLGDGEFQVSPGYRDAIPEETKLHLHYHAQHTPITKAGREAVEDNDFYVHTQNSAHRGAVFNPTKPRWIQEHKKNPFPPFILFL